MGFDGGSAGDYDPRVLSSMRAEAARVLRSFGFAGAHVIILGGLAPSLLIPKPEAGIDSHVGTLDLDVCLSVSLVKGDVGAYDRLEKSLKAAGFRMVKEGGVDVSWRGAVRRVSLTGATLVGDRLNVAPTPFPEGRPVDPVLGSALLSLPSTEQYRLLTCVNPRERIELLISPGDGAADV